MKKRNVSLSDHNEIWRTGPTFAFNMTQEQVLSIFVFHSTIESNTKFKIQLNFIFPLISFEKRKFLFYFNNTSEGSETVLEKVIQKVLHSCSEHFLRDSIQNTKNLEYIFVNIILSPSFSSFFKWNFIYSSILKIFNLWILFSTETFQICGQSLKKSFDVFLSIYKSSQENQGEKNTFNLWGVQKCPNETMNLETSASKLLQIFFLSKIVDSFEI